jgi:hypothetical protein
MLRAMLRQFPLHHQNRLLMGLVKYRHRHRRRRLN